MARTPKQFLQLIAHHSTLTPYLLCDLQPPCGDRDSSSHHPPTLELFRDACNSSLGNTPTSHSSSRRSGYQFACWAGAGVIVNPILI